MGHSSNETFLTDTSCFKELRRVNKVIPLKLYDACKGNTYQIYAVPEIRLLKSLGIRTGMHLTVKTRYAFGGPVLVCVEGAYSIAIGKDIAKQIEVIDSHECFNQSEHVDQHAESIMTEVCNK